MNKKTFLIVGLISVCLISLALNASGQGTTSRFTGTVQDSSGAAVAGATVTLTNEATGISLTTETSESGSYTFDLIQPGTYQVAVERQGFKKFVSNKNVVNINQPTTVKVALEVGDVTAVVTVEGSAEQVQTSTSGNIGSIIEQRTLESLPIVGTRGRNPLSLINFQPGVVNGANTGGGVHVNGSRDRAFNFTLDGIDINESSAGGSNFTPLRTNPDSIQEFQIVTSNFTAELGRSSGAQVTLVTRAGTNRFNGNVFDYYQTPRFNANEYDQNLLGIPRRQFVQHIFGGSVGGPIIKDKFFFFTNLQLLRTTETRLAQRTVYTQAARNGIFRYVQGGRNFPTGTATPSVDSSGNPLFPNCSATVTINCIATYNIAGNPTTTGIDPRLQTIINSAPLPNDFAAGDGLNIAGFNFVAPSTEKQYDFTTRFDYKFADNNLLYVRYAQGQQNTIGDIGNGGLQPFPNTPNLVDTFRDPKNLAINHRWSPTARITNEFIFGLNKFAFSFETPEPDATLPFTFNLVTTPGTNFSFNARRLRTYQFVDNITFDYQPHTIKTGINFRFGRQIDDRSSVAGSAIEPIVDFSRTGTSAVFTGFNLPMTSATTINSNDLTRLQNQVNDFLGRIGNYSQAFISTPDGNSFEPAGTRYNFTSFFPEYDFYVQDNWKVRQNLTVDLGLRWEFKLSPSSEGLSVLRPEPAPSLGNPPTNSIRYSEGSLFQNDLNNYSPSVGIAWDPFKSGKTSIRANYRLAYDRFATFVFASSIFQNTPGNNFGAFQTGGLLRTLSPIPAPVNTPNILRQPAAFGTGSLTVIDPDLRFPEIHQWFFGVQREIGFDSVLEINYIGRRGTHLFGGYDANQVKINATDPRCGSQTFLDAFRAVQAGGASVCLAGLLIGGADTVANTSTFRTQFSSQLSATQNAVASVAQTLSQRSGTTSLTANGFNQFFFKDYPQFTGALNVLDSNDVSRYNALEIIFKRRLKRGLSFQVGYTLAESKDTRSFDPTFTTVSRGTNQSASSTPFDNNNRRLNYAPSDFDRRHALQAIYLYELPFGKGRTFASEIPTALDWVIGGWQLAGTFNLASGRPFTVYSGFNSFSNVVSSIANCNGCSRNLGNIIQESGTNFYFSAEQRALFSVPAAGEIGNTGRNFFIAPRQFQTDASLSKKFRFTERYSFDIRVDAQNLTNTPSFGLPTATFSSGTFGRIRDNVVSGSRRIQFSGKFYF